MFQTGRLHIGQGDNMTTITTIFNGLERIAEIKKNIITIGDYTFILEEGIITCISCGNRTMIVDDIIQLGNGMIRVEIQNYTLDIKVENPFDTALGTSIESGLIESPMSGIVSSIPLKNGDPVKKGDTILIISAMKMENKIITPVDGLIKHISVAEGEQVNSNQLLAEIEVENK